MEELKKRITHYWSHRAEDFRGMRIREFYDDKHQRWLDEFYRYIPKDRKMRVLDLGTGTGYFAFLAAAEGNKATGIDLTREMIRGAKQTAAVLGLDAEFYVMDAEKPAFPPESFDVLLTRNLTWTLPHLPEAYRNWYRLLAPGGVLLNFDADYCRAVMEEEEEEVPLPEDHAHKRVASWLREENDAISMELYAYQMPRPQWDVQLLLAAGFERISVDAGVAKRIYREIDEFYNPVPIFTLAAFK